MALILMEVPATLPLPRYCFGQHVRFGRVDCVHTGCVMGMSWITILPGDEPSWGYHILLDNGQPCKRVEPCPFVFEEEIEEVLSW